MKTKEKNNIIKLENKEKIRNLQKFYVEAELDNINLLVEERKKDIVSKLDEFQKKYVSIQYDKNGNEIKIVNPYLISTYFFKSVNPIASKTPAYNAEKLSIMWELYMYMIEQVNMYLIPFQPSLTHFAKFCGISSLTLSNYRNCGDEDMMNLCEKIYDECFNGNFSLAQSGNLKEKTTISRMKIENEVSENSKPKVSVNVEAKIDLNDINKRLEEIKKFNKRVSSLEKNKKSK